MDYNAWKNLFLITGMVAALYVALAGYLATVCKGWADEEKAREAREDLNRQLKEEREALSSFRQSSEEHNRAIQSQMQLLETKLDPFQETAMARYPTLESEEALSRLSRDLQEVRDLATRDVARPQGGSVVADVAHSLSAWRVAFPATSVLMNLGNADTPSAELVFNRIVSMLRDAGINVQLNRRSSATAARRAPISIGHSGQDQNKAERLIQALTPILRGQATTFTDDDLPEAALSLTLCGLPRFDPHGVVTLE